MSTGYLSVELFKNKHSKRLLIHRLVAEAFIDNVDNLPVVNHKDENPQNNNVNNLEWCTQAYNFTYGTAAHKRKISTNWFYKSKRLKEMARKNGAVTAKSIIQLSKDGEYINEFETINQASRALNINASHIIEVAKGKRKSAGGYVWRYKKGE